MITRFLFVLAATLASTAALAQARVWDFRVFLDEAPIGHHRFTLREDAKGQELTNEARFAVKVLGITAYRYAHDAVELWKGACLASLAARTDDNGERLPVNAILEGERLSVARPQGRQVLEGCVMTFAYWNPSILKETRLLNAQTGEYERVRVTLIGEEKIDVRGGAVTATRYRITGSKHPIDVWYSAQQWVALESTVDGGRRLRYRLS